MSMISQIGRRRLRVRITLWCITLLLVVGSVTMLYPMALMLAGSTKSNVDVSEKTLIPAFLLSESALWRKHVEGMFNESPQLMRSSYQTDAPSFDLLPPPTQPNEKLAKAWLTFLDSTRLPPVYSSAGYFQTPLTTSVLPEAFRQLRRELIQQFDGDIQKLNQSLSTEFYDWNSLIIPAPQYLRRSQMHNELPLTTITSTFIQRQPVSARVYFSIEGFYREQFLRPQYPTIESFNSHHATRHKHYSEIRLARSLSDDASQTPAERATWEQFVRTTLNLLWIRAAPDTAPAYQKYLHAKYAEISALNRNYKTQYSSFDQVPLIVDPPLAGLMLADWDEFVQGWTDPNTRKLHQLPAAALQVHCVDFQFQDALQKRFGTIDHCNQELGTAYGSFASIAPPQEDVHLLDFRNRIRAIRWEFVRRNYLTVADYLLLHGRAAWNTLVYCALAIASALIVNPLAAYALSRYRPQSTYKLLLLLMLTMAFPPMVTQIPVFLLMRDLQMLNTFWALILPGLANGYSIFLLKGFFDSLPKELYESASLDGAGEFRMFWQITMSLSKPILAVVALSAFTSAYSNFMFALLICQDQKMWTLMVWIYQLQARASEGVILAALTLAAIPTLVVFILCQQQIMRGIVVPVEK